jgi:hypothetical protein
MVVEPFTPCVAGHVVGFVCKFFSVDGEMQAFTAELKATSDLVAEVDDARKRQPTLIRPDTIKRVDLQIQHTRSAVAAIEGMLNLDNRAHSWVQIMTKLKWIYNCETARARMNLVRQCHNDLQHLRSRMDLEKSRYLWPGEASFQETNAMFVATAKRMRRRAIMYSGVGEQGSRGLGSGQLNLYHQVFFFVLILSHAGPSLQE